jgi:hypothetical protein
MVPVGWQCQGGAEPQWAKYPNPCIRSFVTNKKSILGFYFIAKMVHIYVAILLALITI